MELDMKLLLVALICCAVLTNTDAQTGLRCFGKDGGCCTANTPCSEGDGDCDSDADCAGDLICGKDNCPKKSPFDNSNGYDDCCVKPEQPGNKWRNDGKCGAKNPLSNGEPAQCDPNGKYPCCNTVSGWCGSSGGHCRCSKCIDYRITGNKVRGDGKCGDNFRLSNNEYSECDPKGKSPCCSRNGNCGNSIYDCKCVGCVDFKKLAREGCNIRTGDRKEIIADQCVFPFSKGGKTCTGPTCCNLDNDPKGSWCSTKTDANGVHISGNYAYCKYTPCDQRFRISSRRRGNFDVKEALEVEQQKQELWGSDGKTDAFDDKNFMEREE